jgi:holo-ACP synthase
MNRLALSDMGVRVSLERMLCAREERVARQATALARFGKPVVSMTVVMPGPVKDGALPRTVLNEALRAMQVLSSTSKWPVLWREFRQHDAGPEALLVISAEPQLLKTATVGLEDQHPLGRLWDLDVIVPGPHILSRSQQGLPPRRCLLCERPATECGRARRHTTQELLDVIQTIAKSHDRQ